MRKVGLEGTASFKFKGQYPFLMIKKKYYDIYN
jgi:hypothetical protein